MATNPTFLNFRYGNQSSLPAFSAADKGTVYVTKDTNRLFIALPGEADYFNTGDFELVSFSSGTAKTALNARPLKRQNILYITVDKDNNTAMWRYNGTDFVAISNTAEIDGIKSDITDLKTAVSALNTFKDTTVPDTYMPKAGGTFSGNVSFASGKTLSVNAPTDNAHAATKQYVDSAKSALLGSSSATTTANATIYDVKRAAAAAQVTANDAQTTATNAMPKSGGTFTGEVTIKEGVALIVNSEPSAGEHAANKTYVDKVAENAGKELYGAIDKAVTDLLGEEGYNGTIKGAYEAAEDAKTAATGANNNANNRVLKSGDTMAGYLTLHSNPTDDMHAATKQYVVSQANSAQAAAEGHADGLASGIRGGYTGSMKDLSGSIEGLVTTTNGLLPKVSPTVTSGHLTLAVETPTDNKHATSKGYVNAQDAATLQSAKNYTDAAKTAILGANDDGSNYVGTVKGAYAAASTASTAASNAQKKADDAYILAGQKTTTAEVKAQIEKYGYATTTVAQSKADAALSSAKSYTDGEISTVNTTISTLKSDIGNLSNIMNFLGKTDTALSNGSTTSKIIIDKKEVTAVKGDVVVNGNKEFVFDGSKWAEIGDVSAQSTAIDGLLERIGNAESDIDNLQADVGSDDGKGALFTRVAALETWKGTHATDYTNLEGRVDTLESWKTTHTNAYNTLNNTVSGHTTAIGTANDGASATGSLYARIKQNYNDINTASSGLKARVGALESWKGTHTTAFNTLSETVTKNGKTIDDLIAVLQWGTF